MTEFARVANKQTLLGSEVAELIVGGISVLVMDANYAESYSSQINAAFDSAVKAAVEKERARCLDQCFDQMYDDDKGLSKKEADYNSGCRDCVDAIRAMCMEAGLS